MNLKMLCKSFFYFIKLIFIKEKYDVVFAYKNHFNRNKDGSNPFLEPFLEVCEKNDIKYLLFEETDLKGAFSIYPRNLNAVPLDFITLLQLILRKIFKSKKNNYTIEEYITREKKISKFLKTIFFRKFHSSTYITLANSNSILWRIINKNTIIADYQHGTRYDGNENDLEKHSHSISLLHGVAYKKLLIESDQSHFYNESNMIDIGYYHPIRNYTNKKNSKTILLTLQQTNNMSLDDTKQHFQVVEKLVEENKDFLLKNKYKILIKNHPRANKSLNLNYPFLTQLDTSISLKEIMNDISIHITFGSTVSFEVSLVGIPTIFLELYDRYSPQHIFYDQYGYPLDALKVSAFKDLKTILHMLEEDKVFSNASICSYNWGKQFYSNFNQKKFLKLINLKGRNN